MMALELVTHRRSLLLGALAGAIAPVLVFLVLAQVARFQSTGELFVDSFVWLTIAAPSVAIAFGLGLPYMVLLRRLRALTAPMVWLGAGGVGSCLVVLLALVMGGAHGNPGPSPLELLRAVATGGALGLVAGLAATLASGIPLRQRKSGII